MIIISFESFLRLVLLCFIIILKYLRDVVVLKDDASNQFLRLLECSKRYFMMHLKFDIGKAFAVRTVAFQLGNCQMCIDFSIFSLKENMLLTVEQKNIYLEKNFIQTINLDLCENFKLYCNLFSLDPLFCCIYKSMRCVIDVFGWVFSPYRERVPVEKF